MANWIQCSYHDTEQQHARAEINNVPVNLDLAVTIIKVADENIDFIIPTKANITWRFINDAVRNLEYARIMGLI